jgi:hypothetical protein
MPQLILYDNYSRDEVHDIFDPKSTFNAQGGTWGHQGIVEVPDRPTGLRVLCNKRFPCA